MSDSSPSTRLMDTEAGGEQTAYESINTVNKPHDRDEGTLGSDSGSERQTDAERQDEREKQARGDQTAENVRYGQAISEEGVGGFTTGQEGEAGQDAIGRNQAQEDSQSLDQTRREQGYGPGSGVGG